MGFIFRGWHNEDNYSADVMVMTADKSFQICGLTTGKAKLVTVDSQMASTTSAGRVKGLTARQISDRTKWCKVLQHESVQNFVRHVRMVISN